MLVVLVEDGEEDGDWYGWEGWFAITEGCCCARALGRREHTTFCSPHDSALGATRSSRRSPKKNRASQWMRKAAKQGKKKTRRSKEKKAKQGKEGRDGGKGKGN